VTAIGDDGVGEELYLLLEGARVTAQSVGAEGLGARLIRMGEAMIASHVSGKGRRVSVRATPVRAGMTSRRLERGAQPGIKLPARTPHRNDRAKPRLGDAT
jgi:hypothetical protein